MYVSVTVDCVLPDSTGAIGDAAFALFTISVTVVVAVP
jgi:hypothetical protein